jgi:hypothetical protein
MDGEFAVDDIGLHVGAPPPPQWFPYVAGACLSIPPSRGYVNVKEDPFTVAAIGGGGGGYIKK